jgi:acid phosphatase type 7
LIEGIGVAPKDAKIMEGRPARRKSGLGLVVLAASLASCSPRVAVEDLPTAEAAFSSAGKRLSQSLSTGDLTALATRGDRVLAALTHGERDALGRGYLRFRIDRAAEVNLAAPRSAPPFWLAEQGFTRTALTLDDNETDWVVYRKLFGPGWVGLGVNGLDRKPTAHYAVFLKALDKNPVRIAELRETGWDIVRAENGVYLQNGLSNSVCALPGELRGATLLRTAHDRRHATLLARGRVWKTHVVATAKPDQVTVSFGADPSRELTWSWRTARDVKTSALWLRKLSATAGGEKEFHGDSELISLPDLLNDPTVRRHTVRVTGLAPGTAYEYALGDMKAGWQTVHTSPVSSSDVSLLYLGDPQCGLEKWGKLLAEAYRRRPDVSAVLIAGDLVDRGNERTNWDHFFLRASGVFERLAVMPAVGNHEYLDRGPWLFRAVFALPDNGPKGVAPDLVYSVEIGDAFLAVLDSTLAVTDPAQARLQAEWLDERLARTGRTWKFVMFHHPLYASHKERESPALRDAWVPVFDRHHVDLVLQGHDHAYLRTYPMRQGRRVGSPAEGTVYVVSVSGDKYYDQDTRDYTEVGFTNVSTYQTIDLKTRENRLVYRSFDVSGRELDGFVIEKAGRSQLTQTGLIRR